MLKSCRIPNAPTAVDVEILRNSSFAPRDFPKFPEEFLMHPQGFMCKSSRNPNATTRTYVKILQNS